MMSVMITMKDVLYVLYLLLSLSFPPLLPLKRGGDSYPEEVGGQGYPGYQSEPSVRIHHRGAAGVSVPRAGLTVHPPGLGGGAIGQAIMHLQVGKVQHSQQHIGWGGERQNVLHSMKKIVHC